MTGSAEGHNGGRHTDPPAPPERRAPGRGRRQADWRDGGTGRGRRHADRQRGGFAWWRRHEDRPRGWEPAGVAAPGDAGEGFGGDDGAGAGAGAGATPSEPQMPHSLLHFRRRHDRLRLSVVRRTERVDRSAIRVSEHDREVAAGLLGHAQRAGHFGASDLYERRMEGLVTASSWADLDVLTADLKELVTGKVRTRMLRVIAKARAQDRLDFDEFCERTDRCLLPLMREDAEKLVGDLGYRVVHPGRHHPDWEPAARRAAFTGLVGGLVGMVLVAVPTSLDLPGGVGQWLPLAIGTGVFTAIGSGIASIAWQVRAPGHAVVPADGGGRESPASQPQAPSGSPQTPTVVQHPPPEIPGGYVTWELT
ncbi:MAG: DUF1707 SHOCT-like domain-containing protein [Acidimicrobiales bacterium]